MLSPLRARRAEQRERCAATPCITIQSSTCRVFRVAFRTFLGMTAEQRSRFVRVLTTGGSDAQREQQQQQPEALIYTDGQEICFRVQGTGARARIPLTSFQSLTSEERETIVAAFSKSRAAEPPAFKAPAPFPAPRANVEKTKPRAPAPAPAPALAPVPSRRRQVPNMNESVLVRLLMSTSEPHEREPASAPAPSSATAPPSLAPPAPPPTPAPAPRARIVANVNEQTGSVLRRILRENNYSLPPRAPPLALAPAPTPAPQARARVRAAHDENSRVEAVILRLLKAATEETASAPAPTPAPRARAPLAERQSPNTTVPTQPVLNYSMAELTEMAQNAARRSPPRGEVTPFRARNLASAPHEPGRNYLEEEQFQRRLELCPPPTDHMIQSARNYRPVERGMWSDLWTLADMAHQIDDRNRNVIKVPANIGVFYATFGEHYSQETWNQLPWRKQKEWDKLYQDVRAQLNRLWRGEGLGDGIRMIWSPLKREEEGRSEAKRPRLL